MSEINTLRTALKIIIDIDAHHIDGCLEDAKQAAKKLLKHIKTSVEHVPELSPFEEST